MASSKSPSRRRTPAVLVNCYRLGFEVGYNSHSEIGWVSQRLSSLLKLADRLGLSKLATQYYERGKRDGTLKRSYDVQARFFKHNVEEKQEAFGRPHLLWSLEQRMLDARFEGISPSTLKPVYLNRPTLVESPRTFHIPKRLFGLDYLNMTRHTRRLMRR